MKLNWKKPFSYLLTFVAGVLIGWVVLLFWMVYELQMNVM